MPAKKVWRQFDEAREFARSLKLRSKGEWEQYCKSGERPNDIPSNPSKTYKNNGWISWGDWLGNEDRIISEETRRKISKARKARKKSL